MKPGRIAHTGPDGLIPRLVAVQPEQRRVIDLATAQQSQPDPEPFYGNALTPKGGDGALPPSPVTSRRVALVDRGLRRAPRQLLRRYLTNRSFPASGCAPSDRTWSGA